MYNRILKRPMFKMGGRSYSAQGTGITSGLDTPRRGLVQHPGGYAGRTLEEIQSEKEEIFKTPEGQNITDIISSFGVYASPYNEDGEAMTSGQLGYEQAKDITKLRKDRKDTQDLAKLTNLNTLEQKLIDEEKAKKKFESDLAITKAGIRPLDVDAKKKLVEQARDMLAKAKIDYKNVVGGIPQHIKDEIEALNTLALGQNYWSIARASEYAAEVYSTEAVLNSMTADQIRKAIDALIAKLTGDRFKIARGGRVGLYNSYPGTVGEAAQITETEEIAPADVSSNTLASDKWSKMNTSEMDQGAGLGEGDEAYQLLRARLPQEITDDIVKLIAYNPSAFQDFATIENQEDVMAFNSKYGVELVIDAPQV